MPAKESSPIMPEREELEAAEVTSGSPPRAKPVWVESDLEFIAALSRRSVDSFRACTQCGNCSATCTISPDSAPYPRKEMAWAKWGMKNRLLADPDVWLCHQCNDCSTRCPCGARPGDVLAAIRHESVLRHAVPRFLSKWVNRPRYIPLLVGVPSAILGLALLARDPIDNALGISARAGDRILYSYSSYFPQWLLNGLFSILLLFVLIALVVGVRRLWNTLTTFAEEYGTEVPRSGLMKSIRTVIVSVVVHKRFSECTTARSRYYFHLCTFFGFLALGLVSLWTIFAPVNPLIRGDFIYPFSFWNPWKILANLGGLALFFGTFLTIRDRLIERPYTNPTTYFEWAFIWTLFGVMLSGFATEAAHYVRIEPHRHIIYFVHLVLVFILIMSLPFSKFVHAIFRTTVMVFSEHTGRNRPSSPPAGGEK